MRALVVLEKADKELGTVGAAIVLPGRLRERGRYAGRGNP
jgi:hypothetical protein